jgi:hypothetical protein
MGIGSEFSPSDVAGRFGGTGGRGGECGGGGGGSGDDDAAAATDAASADDDAMLAADGIGEKLPGARPACGGRCDMEGISPGGGGRCVCVCVSRLRAHAGCLAALAERRGSVERPPPGVVV